MGRDERVVISVFRAAEPASDRRNLIRTAYQVVWFWGVFLGMFPWAIATLEDLLGITRIDSTTLDVAGWCLFAPAGSLGLASAWTMVTAGKGTPLPFACPRRLVVRGPYRHVRNPMAVAGIAQGVAMGLVWGSLSVVVYAFAGIAAWQLLVRPREERDLAERFGADYERYRAAVPCWRVLARGFTLPVVRLVTLADRDTWIGLRCELWPDEDRDAIAAEVDDSLSGEVEWGVLLAEDGGEVAGFAEVSTHEDAPGATTSPVGYLEAWYVRPTARRKGLGRLLVETCEDWSRDRGCTEFASDTDEAHPLSPAAHAACGFVEVERFRFLKAL